MELKEMLIRFVAVAAVLGGAVVLLELGRTDALGYYWFGTLVAVLLLAAGLTIIWIKSSIHRR
jgi:hypothetical protein